MTPDESTILRFHHRLEKQKLADQIFAVVNDLLAQRGPLLKAGTAVDASIMEDGSAQFNQERRSDTRP